MLIEIKRVTKRFDGLFKDDGLNNIKFFIDRRPEMNQSSFLVELNRIQDTISAGYTDTIESIDGEIKTRRFDEPF